MTIQYRGGGVNGFRKPARMAAGGLLASGKQIRGGTMSLVAVMPGAIGCAAADAVRVGDGLAAAHARAFTATTAIIPAAADEVSTAISGAFARFGTDFHHTAATAAGFADQFHHILAAAATTYTAAEHANTLGIAASSGGGSPLIVPLSILGSLIQFVLYSPVQAILLIPALMLLLPVIAGPTLIAMVLSALIH